MSSVRELICNLAVMESTSTWELIFSKVVGPEHSKLVFDFCQLPRRNGINYSLRITSLRNNLARWISLNPKEIYWMVDHMYCETAGRKFRTRSIFVSRITTWGLTLIKITQVRNQRTSSITIPLSEMDHLFKTLYQAENTIRILNNGIRSLPYVEESNWKDVIAGIVIYHYVSIRMELMPPEKRMLEDMGETLADEMILNPTEIIDHIIAFLKYFKMDVTFTDDDLKRAAHETSGLYRGEYHGLKVNDLNDHFPDLLRMMLLVKLGDTRPSWAFTNID